MYSGIRVRDIDGAINFFTKVLGMTLESRVKIPKNKGEFANLTSKGGKHWLELNWYADDSPVAGPFREGEELDHLGFQVDDFDKALNLLKEAGYPVVLGPQRVGSWSVGFVKAFDGIWLDIFKMPKRRLGKKSKSQRRR
jgi:catechol 2,3-dioxygenase-like lactoylglutathione lyase family enzyme